MPDKSGFLFMETIMFYFQGNFIRSKPARHTALACRDKGSVGLILTDLPTRCLPDAPGEGWPPFCDWALVL